MGHEMILNERYGRNVKMGRKMYQVVKSRGLQIGLSLAGVTAVALCASLLTVKIESAQAKAKDQSVEPVLLEAKEFKVLQRATLDVKPEEDKANVNEENQSMESGVVEPSTEQVIPQPTVEEQTPPQINEVKEPEATVEETPPVSDPSAAHLLGLQMNANHLGAIIHRPSSAQLSALQQLNVAEYRENLVEEHVIIVPNEVGSRVKIYQLKFEEGDLVEDGIVFEKYIADEHDVVSLKCYISGGIPNLKIVVEAPNGRFEHILTADGVGNRPATEYFSAY